MTKLHAIPYILILCAMPYNAYAAEATMPIRAGIVARASEYQPLCDAGDISACEYLADARRKGMAIEDYAKPEVLNEIEPAAAPDVDHHGEQVTTEETDNGVIVNFK